MIRLLEIYTRLKNWNLEELESWNPDIEIPDVSKVDTGSHTILSGEEPVRNVSRPEVHLRKT
jgi:hypothetical protein